MPGEDVAATWVVTRDGGTPRRRTAIYRWMGGHDLNDVVDGAAYPASAHKVNPKKIGVYGGHFQDSVRLARRLIELRKENWALAVYPVENHGFIEATSRADEYNRILKLFESNLKQ